MQRHMLLAMPSLAMEERCGGCKESIERDAQICVRCRWVGGCACWHERAALSTGLDKQRLTADTRLLSRAHARTCRGVAYHNRECQRVHWRAGHRHQCQDVESGGLDWAAELEKAEAGLAAWEQGGGDGATNEQRLVMAQLGALAELGGALTNDDLSGAMMGLQLAGQLPGGAEGGLPPGLGDCVLS